MDSGLVLLEVRNSRDSEEAPAAMEQVFAALGVGGGHGGLLSGLFGQKHAPKRFSFEIVSVNTRIHFFVGVNHHGQAYVESQLTAQYPKLMVSTAPDYAPHFFSLPHAIGQMVLVKPYYYPLKTYNDIRDLDILAGVLGQLAKLPMGEAIAIQYCVEPAGSHWQHHASAVVAKGVVDPNDATRVKAHPHARVIETKTTQTGFRTAIRVMAVAPEAGHAEHLLQSVTGSFGVYSLGEGNALSLTGLRFWQQKAFVSAFLHRTMETAPKHQVLGSSELASLWHPPGLALSMIRNISWGAHLTGEAPENLPVATEDEAQKKEINFFGKADYKNKPAVFGIKRPDRRKHLYIVGKTGTGKSTLIANMAINDIRNGEGVAVIDPHGDLCETILDYIPSSRINDLAYLDPADMEYPFHLNPLEVKGDAYRELIASGIVSIFYKLYHFSWGPRLEYILRNTIMTLLYVPNATLLLVPEILTNKNFRSKIVETLPDRVLQNFWQFEFDQMNDKMKSEAVSPILNKVGQFLSSQTIRNIVGSPTSTIDLEEMMNKGKIVIVNLSQGKLGEDSSALLGAMMITKMQLAAMNRVYQTEENRKDFYLYVDEFQNFATRSFIKILSEARKYRLNLTLANQYIGQIDEDVQKAIFGNTGSIISFGVGATDARILASEFGLKYKEEELVALGNYQIVLKLSIDNYTSSPFSATTIPLPKVSNQNREKIIHTSRERYTKRLETPPATGNTPIANEAVQPRATPLAPSTQTQPQPRHFQPAERPPIEKSHTQSRPSPSQHTHRPFSALSESRPPEQQPQRDQQQFQRPMRDNKPRDTRPQGSRPRRDQGVSHPYTGPIQKTAPPASENREDKPQE